MRHPYIADVALTRLHCRSGSARVARSLVGPIAIAVLPNPVAQLRCRSTSGPRARCYYCWCDDTGSGREQRWRGGSAPRPRCPSTVAECAEGRAARGERCMANSARAVAAPHEAPTAVGGAGVKGRFVRRRGGARSLPCAVHHFSAARGKREVGDGDDSTDDVQERGASFFGRANGLGVSCTAGPACRRQSGASVAANELPCSEWRTATAVTP